MLYFIPTPVWNKNDITLRALDLFKQLQIFLCEDTRTTKKLLNMYDIDYQDKNFHSLTSFTHPGKLNFYVDLIRDNDVGVVSESGTPWLSDPGKELVRLCRENDIKFEVLPGANALVPSVVSAFFDSSEFIFLGFLPKKKWKQTKMKFIIQSEIPVFIYESVYRVEKTLQEIKNLWFDGKVLVCREISKMFEQKVCDHIDIVLDKVKKGEIVAKWEFVIWFYNTK